MRTPESILKNAETQADVPESNQTKPPTTANSVAVARPMPNALRYAMAGLLVVGIFAATIFAYYRQTSVKPPTSTASSDACDPVTENRLRETLSKNRNDFATLMDWGDYNHGCLKDYPAAIAAYQQAVRLADDSSNQVPAEARIEAYIGLGASYLFNNNLKEAENQFKLILKEQPNNSAALLYLGLSLAKDKPQEALTTWQKVVDADPTSQAAKQAQQLIDTLKKQLAQPTAK